MTSASHHANHAAARIFDAVARASEFTGNTDLRDRAVKYAAECRGNAGRFDDIFDEVFSPCYRGPRGNA